MGTLAVVLLKRGQPVARVAEPAADRLHRVRCVGWFSGRVREPRSEAVAS